jgi:hypothetical protein
MTTVLLTQTASRRRVRAKAKRILSGEFYPDPALTILCAPDAETVEYFRQLPGADVVPLEEAGRRRILADLRRRRFDVMVTFWTGEGRYRRTKVAVLGLARTTDVDMGDNSHFRLTWRFFLRYWFFRMRHPLPADHARFVLRDGDADDLTGEPAERVLVIQSAEPRFVLRGLEHLRHNPIFRNPRYTLFCRNRPEIVSSFQGHPLLAAVRTHSEARGAWRHWQELRSENFDAVVVFFTGDPSYWKIKYFAFLLGARHKVIFNEHNDCFFVEWRTWVSLLARRMGALSEAGGDLPWRYQAQAAVSWVLKLALLPFRFAWLLLVWLLLRRAGSRSRPGRGTDIRPA